MFLLQFAAILLFLIATSLANMDKVDPEIWKTLQTRQSVDIFATMKDQLDTRTMRGRHFANRGERVKTLRDSLVTYSDNSQKSVLGVIHSRRPSYASSFRTRRFWITNQVYVRDADPNLIQELMNRPDVARIEKEEIIYLDDVPPRGRQTTWNGPGSGIQNNQWGIDRIQAPAVWSGGNTGVGITVGIIDSGTRGSHEILRSSFRNDGYSWFDPVTGSQTPIDDRGHGTHVTGTIVGSNGYGVAPGAKWMSCKAFGYDGSAASSDITACFEFMLCPTNPTGTSSDCSKAPNVINNSWSSRAGYTGYNLIIERLHAAGILPVFANGNEGQNGCSTGRSPADQNTIGVGATTENDELAIFSSKGPASQGRIKPDISAPGQSIQSSMNGSDFDYATTSGTSMAAPHVTGVVTLLLSYKPSLDYDSIKDILQRSTSRTLTFTRDSCGGIPDNQFPNNHFGHGLLNAYAARQLAATYQPPSTTTTTVRTTSSTTQSSGCSQITVHIPMILILFICTFSLVVPIKIE